MRNNPSNLIIAGVVTALQEVRKTFQQRTKTSEVLDAFWCLQDQVHRLVENASDHPDEAFHLIESAHPHLVRDIAELLSFALKRSVIQIPAVSQSCSEINDSLQRLQNLKYQPRSRAASAG